MSLTIDRESGQSIVDAWRTTNRATTYLVENIPREAWPMRVPGIPRQTVRMLAAHLHNTRCGWIRALGAAHGIKAPARVNLQRVDQKELLRAFERSSEALVRLIELGVERGGRVPRATWQNFPPDLPHFLSYFVAHEAHHRGQLCMVLRQLGHRLPKGVADGVWMWTTRSREATAPRARAGKKGRGR